MNQIKNVKPSTRKNKKLQADVCDKTIHFGAREMSDFTKHKDINRRLRYYARHYNKKNITLKDV